MELIPAFESIIKAPFRYLKAFEKRRTLVRRIQAGGPLRIVIGASGVFEEGWIPTDRNALNLVNERDWERYFSTRPIDAILAEHVWEHLGPEEGVVAARNCFRHLKAGGYLRAAVPDGLHPDPAYISYVKPGGSGLGSDDHKVLFSYRSFSRVFESAGFEVRLLEHFDEAGAFQSSDWNPEAGMIHRSKRFDERNQDGILRYSSIILDAYRPVDPGSRE